MTDHMGRLAGCLGCLLSDHAGEAAHFCNARQRLVFFSERMQRAARVQMPLDIKTLHMLIFSYGAKAEQFPADAGIACRDAPKTAHLALRL
jgi:hypothetical protein